MLAKAKDKDRVLRGGCWVMHAIYSSRAYRLFLPDIMANANFGFRVVLRKEWL